MPRGAVKHWELFLCGKSVIRQIAAHPRRSASPWAGLCPASVQPSRLDVVQSTARTGAGFRSLLSAFLPLLPIDLRVGAVTLTQCQCEPCSLASGRGRGEWGQTLPPDLSFCRVGRSGTDAERKTAQKKKKPTSFLRSALSAVPLQRSRPPANGRALWD